MTKNAATATFREVPFQLESIQIAGGKRVEVFEYPYRDMPFVEEYGLAGKEVEVSGFVGGEELDARRDALLTALEKKGTGTLKHSSLGEITGMVGEVTLSTRTDEKRVVRVTFTLYVGESAFPAKMAQSTTLPAAAELQRVAVEEFTAFLPVAHLPRHITGRIYDVRDRILALTDRMHRMLGLPVTDHRARDPVNLRDFAAHLSASLSGLSQHPDRRQQAQHAARILSLSGTTDALIRPAQGEDVRWPLAVTALARQLFLCEAARCLQRSEGEWRDTLVTTLQSFTQQAEALRRDGGDTRYRAVSALLVAVTRDVHEQLKTARRAMKADTLESMPLLNTVSLYCGTTAREQEVLQLNDIRHPLFPPSVLRVPEVK